MRARPASITIDHRTRDEDVLTIDLTDASP